jgi:hypothetical protein
VQTQCHLEQWQEACVQVKNGLIILYKTVESIRRRHAFTYVDSAYSRTIPYQGAMSSDTESPLLSGRLR